MVYILAYPLDIDGLKHNWAQLIEYKNGVAQIADIGIKAKENPYGNIVFILWEDVEDEEFEYEFKASLKPIIKRGHKEIYAVKNICVHLVGGDSLDEVVERAMAICDKNLPHYLAISAPNYDNYFQSNMPLYDGCVIFCEEASLDEALKVAEENEALVLWLAGEVNNDE